MAISNRKVARTADFPKKSWQAVRGTQIPASQTDLKIGVHRPGFRFRVVGVEVFCSALAGTVSVQVKIGTVTVLNAAITPAAAARVAGVLSATLASLIGGAAEDINVEVTTAATSTLDNANVSVVYRPYPLNAEVDAATL